MPACTCSLKHTSFAFFTFCLSNMSMIACPLGGRVENNGFEPLTPCLQSRCSSQLS